ncbi:MAG TPA: hypothetical protein ENJ64_03645 [Thiotrichales bacterium]|nr:hypothetical protein [Thiotrichales bacterium]
MNLADTFFIPARPLSHVPLWVRAGLLLALSMQLGWHFLQAPVVAKAQPLDEPMPVDSYRLLSLNEPLAAAKYFNLWLQSYDTQPGISLSFRQLNYPRIARWLDTILALDPQGQYPLLVAAHIYGSVAEAQKKRFMMDYIYDRYRQQPARYWRWLAHAVIVAKYELNDNALALKYADALAATKADPVPYWARDMKIMVLEDMGELAAAKVLAGGLIASGEITDPYEIRFLGSKIEQLEQKLMKVQQGVEISTENSE